jgi:hypothetical protein
VSLVEEEKADPLSKEREQIGAIRARLTEAILIGVGVAEA